MAIQKARVFTTDQPLRLTREDKPGDKFILLFGKGKSLFLTLGEDRLLHDEFGIGFACEDELLMVDTVDRTGVGIFSLPENHWSEVAAKVHDFETSCRAYQLTHGRSEAEDHFQKLLEASSTTMGRKIVSFVLSRISRSLSWLFWDISRTRWK